ncbi:MAG: hypothetical protein ABI442_11345 [Gemmatimonadaceae bacterium]
MLIVTARTATSQDASLIPGDRDASEQITKIVEATRQNGLPVEPILTKVHYGVSTVHAAPARIVAAARAIASRLPVARDALAPGATPSDIAAGEDALSNGATRESLQAIRAAVGDKPLAFPLGVLAQLVASGVPVQRAAETVVSFVKRGASQQQLADLGNNVNLDVASGAAAISALDARARGLNAVLAPLSAAATAAGIAASAPKKP